MKWDDGCQCREPRSLDGTGHLDELVQLGQPHRSSEGKWGPWGWGRAYVKRGATSGKDEHQAESECGETLCGALHMGWLVLDL